MKKKVEKVKYEVTKVKKENQRSTDKSKPTSARTISARAIAAEICGFQPYEKKAVDYLKADKEKKCLRFLKKRLGKKKAANRRMKNLWSKIR